MCAIGNPSPTYASTHIHGAPARKSNCGMNHRANSYLDTYGDHPIFGGV